jgi:hypothetical protein
VLALALELVVDDGDVGELLEDELLPHPANSSAPLSSTTT